VGHYFLSNLRGIPIVPYLKFKSNLLMQSVFFLQAAFATRILNLSEFYFIGAHQSKRNNKENKIINLCQVPEAMTTKLDNNENRVCVIVLGKIYVD
jgi:hypothetical protein